VERKKRFQILYFHKLIPREDEEFERERNHNPEVDQGTISKGNEKKSL